MSYLDSQFLLPFPGEPLTQIIRSKASQFLYDQGSASTSIPSSLELLSRAASPESSSTSSHEKRPVIGLPEKTSEEVPPRRIPKITKVKIKVKGGTGAETET